MIHVGNTHKRECPQAGMPTARNAHQLIRLEVGIRGSGYSR